MPLLVGFGTAQVQHDALANAFDVRYVEPHQFGAPKPARETDQQQGSVSDVFQTVSRGIEHGQQVVAEQGLAAAELDPARYSGHSLRAGLATSAAQAGVPTWRIRAQTRHASDAMLSRYIRDGELFTDNASGALL